MKTELKVVGMTCGHCTGTVERTLNALEGVQSVSATLPTSVVVEHTLELAKIQEAITKLGYQVQDA